jgi:hypothetical protein
MNTIRAPAPAGKPGRDDFDEGGDHTRNFYEKMSPLRQVHICVGTGLQDMGGTSEEPSQEKEN